MCLFAHLSLSDMVGDGKNVTTACEVSASRWLCSVTFIRKDIQPPSEVPQTDKRHLPPHPMTFTDPRSRWLAVSRLRDTAQRAEKYRGLYDVIECGCGLLFKLLLMPYLF